MTGNGEGTACKEDIVFSVCYVQQMNVKILIGQNVLTYKSIPLNGQCYVTQILDRHSSVITNSYSTWWIYRKLTCSSDSSVLEENGFNFELKDEKINAIRQLCERKDLLAILKG